MSHLNRFPERVLTDIGAYSCPGKNMAYMTLRIALSQIVQKLDFDFAPGEDGHKFNTETKETFVATLAPLMLQFAKRTN